MERITISEANREEVVANIAIGDVVGDAEHEQRRTVTEANRGELLAERIVPGAAITVVRGDGA